MIDTFVLFGAGGDLAHRLVRPAIDRCAPTVRVLGADVRGDADNGVDVRADVSAASDVASVLDRAGSGPLAVYLALPTQLMLPAVRNLAAHGLPPGSRVAIEKPFGHDGASAAELDAACAPLPDVYRVDHFLAMTGVGQLPALAGDWSSRTVRQLDLLFEETLALEGRASFYDRAGALRDVVQNHLLAVLATLTAEPADDIAQARANTLRSVAPIDVADTVWARYEGYVDEPGVDPARGTETFVQLVLHLQSPRWHGTRFVLRAGKALAERRRGIVAHPQPDVALSPTRVDFDLPEADGSAAEPHAYDRIVTDFLSGSHAYSLSAPEILESWRIVDPVLRARANDDLPLRTYSPGSSGPAEPS